MTNSEFITRVTQGVRAISKDAAIRRRYILTIGRTIAKTYMSQKLDELSLSKDASIRTKIECFPMKRVKSKDCGVIELRTCKRIMKSCNRLPEGIYGKIGPGILEVENIDEERSYKYRTPQEYKRLNKRKYRLNNNKYYTIVDGYLLALETTAELLDVTMIAMNKREAQSLSGCTGDKVKCQSIWDDEFVCPDRLLNNVITATINEIAGYYRTSIPDENPNLDEYQKTKTVQ